MTIRAQQTSNDYQILVEPLSGETIALSGTDVLARSTRARVMYETRLPPVVYFPKDDILADLEPAPGHKTFCPFKGTASYQHVKLAGKNACEWRLVLSERTAGRASRRRVSRLYARSRDFDGEH